MFLKSRFVEIRNNSFVKAAGVLVGGTAFSQLIALIALPFITRLYTPADFSLFAVFGAMVSILSVVSCLRYELAIPMPKEKEAALSVFLLAISFSVLVSGLLVMLMVLITPEYFSILLNQPDLSPYLWLVPLSVLFMGSYAAIQNLLIREKNFHEVAKARVVQSAVSVGTQLTLGWLALSSIGLIIGQVIGAAIGVIFLGYKVIKNNAQDLRNISIKSMQKQAGEYKKFPKYSTFDALANVGGTYLPVILIASFLAGPEAGFLMLAMRVMQSPMSIIGGAVSQVYLSEAPDKFRNGNLPDYTSQIIVKLIKAGVGPVVCLSIVAPEVFQFIFGVEWRRAGELVTWMLPWFLLQFLISPVSMVMHIKNQQKQMLILTISGLLIRVGAILVAIMYAPKYLSESYAIASAIFYLVCFFVFTKKAGISLNMLMNLIKPSLLSAIVGVLVAMPLISIIDFLK